MTTRRDFLKLVAATVVTLALPLPDAAKRERNLDRLIADLGRRAGLSASEAIDEFCVMIEHQSVPCLDMFGISAGNVRRRIERMTKECRQDCANGAWRQAVFMTAVLQEGNHVMERM